MKLNARCRSLASCQIALMLSVLGVALMLSRPVLAQSPAAQPARERGEQSLRQQTVVRKAHALQTEGVKLTTKKATLKPGYKFIRKSNNTVVVARKRKEVEPPVVTLTCVCNSPTTNGGCNITVVGGIATCNGNCSGSCAFNTTVNAPQTQHRH